LHTSGSRLEKIRKLSRPHSPTFSNALIFEKFAAYCANSPCRKSLWLKDVSFAREVARRLGMCKIDGLQYIRLSSRCCNVLCKVQELSKEGVKRAIWYLNGKKGGCGICSLEINFNFEDLKQSSLSEVRSGVQPQSSPCESRSQNVEAFMRPTANRLITLL
jgi:hypothetical protein